jgi:hypothetical protein
MSVYVLKGPIFQRSPRVWRDSQNLYARTSRWYQLLNLGSYCRTVRVSRQSRQIIITVRRLWFMIRRVAIPFAAVEYVDRSRWDVPNSVGFTTEGLAATDVTEVWYVRAKLKGRAQSVSLFRFVGAGARPTGWLAVVLGGDTLLDFEGVQDSKADTYARLVAEYAGVEYKG